MPFAPFIWSIVTWLFRSVVIKFVIMGLIFILVSELTPIVIEFLGSFISTSSLESNFSAIPSGVWFFIDFLALGYGIPLLISAYVARFLIRRIPFIG